MMFIDEKDQKDQVDVTEEREGKEEVVEEVTVPRSRLVGGVCDGVPVVGCFLCRDLLEVKQSSRGKPYFGCPSCGMRSFINGNRGISHLSRIIYDEGVLSNGHGQKAKRPAWLKPPAERVKEGEKAKRPAWLKPPVEIAIAEPPVVRIARAYEQEAAVLEQEQVKLLKQAIAILKREVVALEQERVKLLRLVKYA